MDVVAGNQSLKSDLHWYAVYTKSRYEKKAVEELTGKGIECYLPIKKVKRTWGKQSRIVDFPLISCYIFVRVNRFVYYDVLVANGVMWYVCFNGKPAVIPDYQIQSLKVIEKNYNDQMIVTSERIDKGDLIEVSGGALDGTRAEVVRISGKRKLVLRFHTLGCCIHVDAESIGFKRIEKAVLR